MMRRLASLFVAACFLTALVGIGKVAIENGRSAGRAVLSGSLARSAWPIPTAELRRHLPARGTVFFATDRADREAFYTHGHLQNRLAPLIVLRDPGPPAEPPPPDRASIVLVFGDPAAEAAYAASRNVVVAARPAPGFAVGERRP